MNIGSKIKELRSAKMMTQQELAGEMITRNMLSRIENGCALPSLPTLMYIAERLGVPAGFLLSEAEEEFNYKKSARMPDIIRAYEAGDWQICIDLCKSLGDADDELRYILFLCLYNEAKEAFNSGDLRKSAELFDLARMSSDSTIYPTDTVVAECDTYLFCIGHISASLVSDIETVSEPLYDSFADEFCRYFSMLYAMESKEVSVFDLNKYTAMNDGGDLLLYDHVTAKTKMNSGHYTDAYHILKHILASDTNIPAPVLYFIFCDLEICCRELSDYRGAYEYSNDKTGMFEKFLG